MRRIGYTISHRSVQLGVLADICKAKPGTYFVVRGSGNYSDLYLVTNVRRVSHGGVSLTSFSEYGTSRETRPATALIEVKAADLHGLDIQKRFKSR